MACKRCRYSATDVESITGSSGQAEYVLVETLADGAFSVEFKIVRRGWWWPVIGIIPTSKKVNNAELTDRDAFLGRDAGGFFVASTGAFPRTMDMRCRVKKVAGAKLHLSFCPMPRPKLCSITSSGDATELDFGVPIPSVDYSLYVILSASETVKVSHMASHLDSAKRRRVRTSAARLLHQMWDAMEFTDAELVGNGRAVAAHRAVLCKASPVFAAAFRGGMKEATASRVDIPDAAPEIIEAMLRFIYVGVLNPEDAPDVLPLAHRYQLDDLTAECCLQMLQSLNTSNVAATVKALRAFRDQDPVAQIWEKLTSTISSDGALCRAALETM